MVTGNRADDASGHALFPEFLALPTMVRAELLGLTNEQLDYESDNWAWSRWSIRRQVSHLASLTYRWLLVRWGGQLLPDGTGLDPEQLDALTASAYDRRLDEHIFWEIEEIQRALVNALALARALLSAETVASMRARTEDVQQGPHWDLMALAHPTGITAGGQPGARRLTLEATFRHIYFEFITHLYNIQRLKRAQDLIAVVQLPEVGYWTLNGWDRSEP